MYKRVIISRIGMSARCETVNKHVLPLFRALVAKELLCNYKLTQVEVAKKLGTTQAAISQYLNSKRAIKGTEQLTEIMPKVQALARETAEELARKEAGEDDPPLDFCKLCRTLFEEDQEKSGSDYSI